MPVMQDIQAMRPMTAAERAYQAIEQMIASGRFRAGQWFTKAEVGKELGLSATPVGQALQRLEQEGLVQLMPAWGARVRALTVDEYEEAADERAVLEGLVAARCAERASTEELTALKPLAEDVDHRMMVMVKKPQLDTELRRTIIVDDWKLHDRLGELSQLKLVVRDIARLQLMALTCRFDLPRVLPTTGLVTHAELLSAILSRDARRADMAMREHIWRVSHTIVPMLRERFGTGPITYEEPTKG